MGGTLVTMILMIFQEEDVEDNLYLKRKIKMKKYQEKLKKYHLLKQSGILKQTKVGNEWEHVTKAGKQLHKNVVK